MTSSRVLSVVAIAVLFSAYPSTSEGQSTEVSQAGCETFDTCALRVRYRLFRTEVVRGAAGARVAGIGLGSPPLDELFARSERSMVSFDAFKKDHARSSFLMVLGGLEIAGGLVASARDHEDWSRALTISGIVIEVAAMVFRTRAQEHLSDAIWWHNRSLREAGASF